MGPRLLVLGKEAQANGLGVSLLERLHRSYKKLRCQASSCYVGSLENNHRCHRDIVSLFSELFYDSTLRSVISDEVSHPEARYPLLFVCSSLEDSSRAVDACTNEQEARLVLEQVQRFMECWPEQRWGRKKLSEVCVMMANRKQVS